MGLWASRGAVSTDSLETWGSGKVPILSSVSRWKADDPVGRLGVLPLLYGYAVATLHQEGFIRGISPDSMPSQSQESTRMFPVRNGERKECSIVQNVQVETFFFFSLPFGFFIILSRQGSGKKYRRDPERQESHG
jgi:hypothetical protein